MDSAYRRQKVNALEIDYPEYVQEQQGFFVIRCQMMNLELSKIAKAGVNLSELMQSFKNFNKLRSEIEQDTMFKGFKTLVIDIENTLVAQLDIKTKQELDHLSEQQNFL